MIKHYHRGYVHLWVMSPVLQIELPIVKFLKILIIIKYEGTGETYSVAAPFSMSLQCVS